ncbi:hypothetical protein M0Q50_02985 [bacterium]|jgi:hypothetical protein|nr:hypothetical protein [bacterium]
MADNKFVLIVENTVNKLNENVQVVNGKKEYILSGIFTEFDVLNRNERIYTADKFIPHLNELNERKNTLGAIYGEFDHPDVFDTSLSRISHTIEKCFFNKEKNRVDGEIRLLNTHWGKEAKALIDDKCPLFVSSRAAGITESNGTVTVKKLFTYDAVADPGFSSAKMEIKSMNESCGFTSKSNFRIYDISDESKINELFNMNNNDFVTKQQMIDYSNYLTEEISKVKGQLNNGIKSGKVEPEKITEMSDLYENLRQTQEKIIGYLDYLAETVQSYSIHLDEKVEKSINYSEYIAETLDKNIDFAEYIAENVNKNIEFSDYLAESLEKSINYSEYIAENLDKNIAYSEYIAESVDKNIAYAEYIAENLDKNIAYAEYIAENVDKSISYAEYIAENVDKNIAYAEYLADNLDNNIAYAEYIAEHVDNNIAYSEYIAENVSDGQAYVNYIAEGLDKTIETLKSGKLNEEFGQDTQVQFPDMKDVDVQKYYDEDDDDDDDDDEDDDDDVQVQVNAGQELDVQAQTGSELDVQAQAGSDVDVQAQVGSDIQIQTQPIQGQPIQQGQPVQIQQPIPGQGIQGDVQSSIEGQPLQQGGFVQGSTVTLDKTSTATVLAYSPENNIITLSLDGTGEQVQVSESRVTKISFDGNEGTLKNLVGNLITETKKRKASETNTPNFIQFLTEKNKQAWYGLSAEDREKVIFAINESNEQIYSESQLLYSINKTLSEVKSDDDILLENMPSSLKPLWESIDEKYRTSVISQSKLYPNLSTAKQIEAFWESRNLEKYLSLKETKQILNENKKFDNDSLSDDYIDSFISKIKNL